MSGCRVDFAAEKEAARFAENFEPPFRRPRTASRWRIGAAVGSSSRTHRGFRALWIALLFALFLWTTPGVLPWLLRQVRAEKRDVYAAWTFVAFRGSAADKTSDTTIAMNPTANLAVGAIVLAMAASDNNATADGETSEHTVTDSKSNKWHKMREQCESAGASNAGATVSAWACKVATAILTTDTITLTTSAAKTSKCIGAIEVSSTAGAWDCIDSAGTSAGSTAAPSQASLTIKSAAVLALGVVGREGPTEDGFTQDADYANDTGFGTTGGTGNTNVSIRFGTRIATLTGDTYAPTLGTARDCAIILVLFREAATKTRTRMVKSSGGHHASLNAYESNQQADLPTAQEIRQAECWAFDDSSGEVVFDGWTTSATYHIRVYTPAGERHDGTAGTGYRLRTPSGNGLDVLDAREENFRVEGVELWRAAGDEAGQGFRASATGTFDIRMSHCLVHDNIVSITCSAGGASSKLRLWNTILYGHSSADATYEQAIRLDAANVTLYCYCVTACDLATFGSKTVFDRLAGTFQIKNCVAQNPNNALGSGSVHYNGTFTNAEYNLSGDGTAPGTNSRLNKTVSFAGAAGRDFRLSTGDAEARDFGKDLSADPDLAFADDIDGNTRPQGSAWDMGADEALVAAERRQELMGVGW